ncbi:zinc ribbon domain-containing protein [Streptomyces boncukensis]|uniref:Transposase n=1 Tax=Streptomyces boncukensis TaxID=2711219 RepID=A0A6G4WVX8_9ACTN|nr:transposase [Streptomyces boncukensis]
MSGASQGPRAGKLGPFRGRVVYYKATRRGRTFVKVARDFPSSQICSACGHRDGKKPLQVRAWTCPDCAVRHCRDWNAGKNVRYEGRRILSATAPPTPGPGASRR